MVGFGGIEKLIINFAVIFIVATIAAGVLPGTANKLFAATKDTFGYGDPSIADFSVKLKDSNHFSIGYTILGDSGKVSKVVVSRRYKEYVDSPVGSREPIMKGSLTLEEGDVSSQLRDNKDGIGPENVPIVDSIASKAVGIHRFTIELYMTDGRVISEGDDDEEIKIYDEAYVELYDRNIDGCSDCNVIKCKAAQIDGIPSNTLSRQQNCKQSVNKLKKEVCVSSGLSDDCKCPGGNCPKEKVEEVNIKMARAVLMINVCKENRQWDREEDYVNVPADKFEEHLEASASTAAQCGVKGYNAFDSAGWSPIDGFERQSRKNSVKAYLETLIGPFINNFVAGSNSARSIILSWDLSWQKNIGSYELDHTYYRYAAKTGSVNIPEVPPVTDSKIIPNNANGWHKVVLKVKNKAGQVTSETSDAWIGFYDDEYIEFYDTSEGCSTDSCNVMLQKLVWMSDSLSNVPQLTGQSYESLGYPTKLASGSSSCNFNIYDVPTLKNCNPGEVQELFESTVNFYVNRDYAVLTEGERNEIMSTILSCEGKHRAGLVCWAKENLHNKLQSLGWIKVG